MIYKFIFQFCCNIVNDILIFKRAGALSILASYAVIAGLIGGNPLPFSDVVLLIPIQITMIVALAAVYGIFKTKTEALSLIASFSVQTAISVAGRTIASGIKLIPAVGTIAGSVVDGIISASFTSILFTINNGKCTRSGINFKYFWYVLILVINWLNLL